MIKFLAAFIFGLLLTGSLRGQDSTVVVNDLSGVVRVEHSGTFEYVSAVGGIYIVDMLNANPTPALFLAIDEVPGDLALADSFLYYSLFEEGAVYRVPATQTPNPTPELVVGGIVLANGLAIRDEMLYCVSTNSGTLFRVDLSGTDFMAETVIETGADFAVNISLFNEDILVNDVSGDRILRITGLGEGEIPAVSVLVPPGLISGPNSSLQFDNFILVSGIFDGNLYAIDTTDYSTVDTLLSGLVQPTGVSSFSETIYICVRSTGQIISLNRPIVSGTEEVRFADGVSVYPNPASDYLRFDKLDEELHYQIFNTAGQLVLDGTLTIGASIDLRQLQAGPYLLRATDGRSLRFVKQ
ncbi:hypothetical protein CEQ90_19050 [Lewinellaceae bacterium SD302]|nr:hypothetical protein CEQ90_19050 [Lewinellaceae bacterium SD302]